MPNQLMSNTRLTWPTRVRTDIATRTPLVSHGFSYRNVVTNCIMFRLFGCIPTSTVSQSRAIFIQRWRLSASEQFRRVSFLRCISLNAAPHGGWVTDQLLHIPGSTLGYFCPTERGAGRLHLQQHTPACARVACLRGVSSLRHHVLFLMLEFSDA